MALALVVDMAFASALAVGTAFELVVDMAFALAFAFALAVGMAFALVVGMAFAFELAAGMAFASFVVPLVLVLAYSQLDTAFALNTLNPFC
jgi:hypothetical protein